MSGIDIWHKLSIMYCMVSIQTIAKETGLSRTWLYENGVHTADEKGQIEALLSISAKMRRVAREKAEHAARVRGYAIVLACELAIDENSQGEA